jgi:hypothetical protein
VSDENNDEKKTSSSDPPPSEKKPEKKAEKSEAKKSEPKKSEAAAKPAAKASGSSAGGAGPYALPSSMHSAWKIAAGVGVVGLGATASQMFGSDGARASYSYVFGFVVFLTMALGCLFFVLIQHLTSAGWSVTMRRTAEMFAAGLPVFAVLWIPLVLSSKHLYPWTTEFEETHHAEVKQGGEHGGGSTKNTKKARSYRSKRQRTRRKGSTPLSPITHPKAMRPSNTKTAAAAAPERAVAAATATDQAQVTRVARIRAARSTTRSRTSTRRSGGARPKKKN